MYVKHLGSWTYAFILPFTPADICFLNITFHTPPAASTFTFLSGATPFHAFHSPPSTFYHPYLQLFLGSDHRRFSQSTTREHLGYRPLPAYCITFYVPALPVRWDCFRVMGNLPARPSHRTPPFHLPCCRLLLPEGRAWFHYALPCSHTMTLPTCCVATIFHT